MTGYRILGVDPGSNCTGYGVVEGAGNRFRYIGSGTISPGRSATRYEKLEFIFRSVSDAISEHEPTHFAIEDIFYAKNARSSLVLGEARGVAILAATLADVPVFEYSPREVKQSVTGNGGADKAQVGYMLAQILSLTQLPKSTDESDALAIALCHAFKNREWSAVK